MIRPGGGGTYRGGGAAIVPGGGPRYAGRGYHGHRRYYGYGGPAIVGGWGWGWGWGAPYYYDYPYYQPYYGYERCWTRRVKVKGKWVRRRYCEY